MIVLDIPGNWKRKLTLQKSQIAQSAKSHDPVFVMI